MKTAWVLSLVALLTACAIEPDLASASVTLTASATDGTVPFEVRFSAHTTSSASGYTWKLDGETLPTLEPELVYTFDAPGLYVVTVTATTSVGTASDSITVTVRGREGGPTPPEVPVGDREIRVTQTPGGPAPWAVRYDVEVSGYGEGTLVRMWCSDVGNRGYERDGELTCVHTAAREQVHIKVLTADHESIGSATIDSEVTAPEEGVAFLGTWRYAARGVTETFEISKGTETAGASEDGAFKLFVIKQDGRNIVEFTFGGRTVELFPAPENDGQQVFFGEVYGLRLERIN